MEAPPPIPPTDPASPGAAPTPLESSTEETRRLLAEAKAAFAAEQAAADAEETADGPSVFARGKKLVDDVREDPVQAVADRLDERLGDHRKAIALGLIAGSAVLVLQSRWVRKKVLPVVASAGTAFLQDRARDWFSKEKPEEAEEPEVEAEERPKRPRKRS